MIQPSIDAFLDRTKIEMSMKRSVQRKNNKIKSNNEHNSINNINNAPITTTNPNCTSISSSCRKEHLHRKSSNGILPHQKQNTPIIANILRPKILIFYRFYPKRVQLILKLHRKTNSLINPISAQNHLLIY